MRSKEDYDKIIAANNESNSQQPALSDEQLAVCSNADESNTITICKDQQIPDGFVIIAQTTNFQCPSNLDNAWIIKRPGQRELVCAVSPIPPGYVITGRDTNFQCPSNLDNALRIQKV